MTRYPRVAILVLNYNGADCLPQCLSSLQKLEYQNFQVVVIDNGSTDDSFLTARKNFSHCIFLPQKKNTGFAQGMNIGIRYAVKEGYDFVWLMNYDAHVFPDTLSYLIESFQEDPHREAQSPVIQNMDGSIWFAGGTINYLRMRTEHSQRILASVPYETGFLTGCAPLFTVALLQKVGFFDERFFLYYEDADLSRRILNAGNKLFVVPSARILHAEKSEMNPQKLYYLVYFGLLFFALHTPRSLRIYIAGYVTIRRLVNQIKLLLGLSGARTVASAYADYFQKFQAGDHVYLRKLS